MDPHGAGPAPVALPADRTTLAAWVAPFGRLPAAAVAVVADELLQALEQAHAAGAAGHDLQPESVVVRADGKVELRAGTSPYWLLPPERARGAPATASGDLFSTGALLLHLLTGARALDAGTPAATAERLLKLTQPLPVSALVPALPGFLERLLLALLQPDPARRPVDAHAARALVADALAQLAPTLPNAMAVLVRDARAACHAMHELQALAEAQRGAMLLGQAAMRRPAAVALLRSQALVPGRAEVEQRLAQAAAAGVIRPGAARDPELLEVLQAIHAAEPAPRPAHLRRAAELLLAGGELVEAAAMIKRVLAGRPDDLALRHQLDALVGPQDERAPWQAGASWVLDRVAAPPGAAPSAAAAAEPVPEGALPESDHGAPSAQAPAPSVPTFPGDDVPVRGQLGSLLRALGAAYASLDGRARLFILALAGSALLSIFVYAANQLAGGSDAERLASLEALARNADDCGPGGGVRLLRAWQAARAGDADATEEQLATAGFDDTAIPAGTRCQRYGLSLQGMALARKGGDGDFVHPGPDSVDELTALLGSAGFKVGPAPKHGALTQELDNLNDALSSGVPMPKLARRFTIDGVPVSVFWCPGKAEQAGRVVTARVTGAHPDDAQYLHLAADALSGAVDLPSGPLILSLEEPEGDATRAATALDKVALKLALALARL